MSVAAAAHARRHRRSHPPGTAGLRPPVRLFARSQDHRDPVHHYGVRLLHAIAGCWPKSIRTQLLNANGGFVAPDTYNEVYSVHGSAMVWLVIIPLLTGGFGNFVFPLQIGARDVAFPWLNMLSFWIFPVAGLMLFSSFLIGAPTAGWTEYPPISLQGAAGTSMWCAAIFFVGVSSTHDRHQLRRHDSQDARARHDLHAHAALLLGPVCDRAAADDRDDGARRGARRALHRARSSACRSTIRRKGGSPVLWQHMFWFYSHPAVYIMISAGVRHHLRSAADVRAQADLRLQADRVLVDGDRARRLHGLGAPHVHVGSGAVLAAAVHDPHVRRSAIPTGIKIFSWTATLWGGKIHFYDRDALRDRLHRARSRSAASPASSWPRFPSICTCTARTSSSRTSTTCSSAAA